MGANRTCYVSHFRTLFDIMRKLRSIMCPSEKYAIPSVVYKADVKTSSKLDWLSLREPLPSTELRGRGDECFGLWTLMEDI